MFTDASGPFIRNGTASIERSTDPPHPLVTLQQPYRHQHRLMKHQDIRWSTSRMKLAGHPSLLSIDDDRAQPKIESEESSVLG